MKRIALSVLVLGLLATVTVGAQEAQNQSVEPPMLGVHWAKGFSPLRPLSNPDMTWHSGKVMTTAATASIFWGPTWVSKPGDKISGMDKWYEGFGGSNYAGTSNEYSGSNGKVTSSVSYGGHFVDSSKATGGQNPSAILAEVCKVIPNPVANGYYAVYTDIPRGSAGYCAYHSYSSCKSTQVQFAFFWKLDGDGGCDPQSNVSGESQGLAALANVSGHELSEARTDPRNGGWYDSLNGENGDKCAWTFNVPYVTFKDGTKWKIQGEWSNKAYNAGTGYPNGSGQKGCLAGK